MERQPHPTFAKGFQAIFLRAWLVAFVCFMGGLLLLKNGLMVGWILAIAFGIAVAGTLAYLFHQLYHVACPRCGLETRTLQDRPRSAMVAICDRCRVTWDLGVRIGTGQ